MNGATAYIAAIGYVLFLFLIAWWGDRGGRRFIAGGPRAVVYALSLAVYCTSWTYYGSVGLASSHGLDFLPIYIGPILVIGLGSAFVGRIANLARAQNLTTVADFVSARYGKSQPVAAVAALIALVGSAPYVALQLKAVSTTLLTVVASLDKPLLVADKPSALFSLAIALVLAVFAIAFGTRRLNPKERQEGLILAIAVESIVKLVAFLAVGAFVVWGMNGGLADLTQAALSNPKIAAVVQTRPDPAVWGVTTLLSAFAILLLPRQFHVAVVENHDRRDIRTASWLFPAYLVLINLFVAPLAIAGLKMFPDGAIDRDLTVLALPLAAHAHGLALLTMIGGLSAATGMIVVDSLALAITVSNDLVMPLLLRRKAIPTQARRAGDIGALALWVRRLSILGVLGLGFAYERLTSETALVSIGLLSFAAVAQIAPGLPRRPVLAARHRARRARRHGGGIARLALPAAPALARVARAAIAAYLAHGPLAIAWLSPAALTAFAPSPLVGGVVVSLALNLAAFVAFSLMRQPTALERAQANAFAGAGGKPQAFRLWRSSTTAGELEAAVARYLGAARARRAFAAFMRERGQDYDPEREASAHLIRHAEFLLSPAIGASTSRQVLSLLLRPRAVSGQSALKLIDEASAAIQSSRDQLQHALDHARQGVTVFDSNLALTAWNREFADLFDLPQALLRHGVGLDEIVRFNAARGAYGPGDSEDFVAERVASLLYDDQPTRLQALLHPSGDRDPLGAAAGRRHRHHLHRHHPDRADRGGAGGGQRIPGEAGRRAHRRTAAPERRARRRQDGGGRGEPVQDALPRRREPRHSPAPQRRAPLRELARRGRRRRKRRRPRRSRAQGRHVARGGRGDSRRPARHLAARRRARPGRKSPTRRSPISCACWRSSSRRSRGRRGSSFGFVPTQARDPHRSPADAPPAAEPRLQRASNIPCAARCWSAAGACRRRAPDRGLGHRARHPGRPAARRCSRSSSGSTRAPGSRAASASASASSSGSAGCSTTRWASNSRPGEGSVFHVTAPLGAAARRPRPRTPLAPPALRRRAAERPEDPGDRQRAARARRHAGAAQPLGLPGRRPPMASPRRARR